MLNQDLESAAKRLSGLAGCTSVDFANASTAATLDAWTLAIAYLRLLHPRPLSEWHEDDGCVVWWRLPVCEPPYCGTPLDTDWTEDYYTHWTPLVVPPREVEP